MVEVWSVCRSGGHQQHLREHETPWNTHLLPKYMSTSCGLSPFLTNPLVSPDRTHCSSNGHSGTGPTKQHPWCRIVLSSTRSLLYIAQQIGKPMMSPVVCGAVRHGSVYMTGSELWRMVHPRQCHADCVCVNGSRVGSGGGGGGAEPVCTVGWAGSEQRTEARPAPFGVGSVHPLS